MWLRDFNNGKLEESLMLRLSIHRRSMCRFLIVTGIISSSLLNASTPSQTSQFDNSRPIEEFSPAFLGIYRKVIEIEPDIRRSAATYNVDIDLALAVCLYESGGNANLNSHAGAQGYFQVMPATFRSLGVATNIEAGVKYLSQMIARFDREDFALAAYNGGPGRVSRGRPPLESLQYVLGVGHYRSVLKLYKRSIRYHAQRLSLVSVREGDDWWTISERTGVPILQLRIHNPFLATRALHAGQLMAVPSAPRTDLFTHTGQELRYITRKGDNYFNLAFTLDIELDVLRDTNGLWRLQTLPDGQALTIPVTWEGEHDQHLVQPGDTLRTIADERNSEPWHIIRDNYLFHNQSISPGMLLKVRPETPQPTYTTHRVVQGDTLVALARRYGTTVRSIQAANQLGQITTIRIGQQLRIPTQPIS
jgi:LysM repeat protein